MASRKKTSAAADADPIDLARRVTWKGAADISDLAGKPGRLRFALSDADLYSLQFIPLPG